MSADAVCDSETNQWRDMVVVVDDDSKSKPGPCNGDPPEGATEAICNLQTGEWVTHEQSSAKNATQESTPDDDTSKTEKGETPASPESTPEMTPPVEASKDGSEASSTVPESAENEKEATSTENVIPAKTS
jgi:hypothetical protein